MDLSGQITIAVTAGAQPGGAGPLFLSGRIVATTKAVGLFGSVPPFPVSGAIRASVAATVAPVFSFPLHASQIVTQSAARLTFSFTPVLLDGRVSAQSSARIHYPGTGPFLRGRVTTRITGRATFPGAGPWLSGTVVSFSTARFADPAQGAILYGHVVAFSMGRFGVPAPATLSGQITATTAAQVLTPGSGPFLSGRITAEISASSRFVEIGSLSGVIVTQSAASTQYRGMGDLSGVITAASVAGADPAWAVPLSGTVASLSTGTAYFPPRILLDAILTTISTATLVGQETLYLYGGISGVVSASASWPEPFPLSGQIAFAVSALVEGVYPEIREVGGVIAASVSASITGSFLTFLDGVIEAQVGISAPADYISFFSGQVTITTGAGGFAFPRINLIGARITSAVQAWFGIDVGAELVQPLPPYPVAFPVQTLEHYLDFITSEHNQKPKYMQTVSIGVEPFVAQQALTASIPALFDLDYAVGEQLDFTGQWVGKSRWIEIPNVFFSWDQEGIGWNQANWRGQLDTDTHLQRLDDYHYRILLYASVIANHWNGSVPAAYAAWDELFEYTGMKVVIQDYGNMSMIYGLLWNYEPDTVLLSLFVNGQMDLKPEGVEILAYAYQDEPGIPFFGFDAQNETVSGWDSGEFAILVPPGEGYIPI